MHAFTRMKRAGWAALAGLLLVLSSGTTASAKPAPGYKASGFRLFARVTSAIAGNRVSCGIIADGRVCPDSTGSSTVGGGFWPRGTLNQYVFNSGMQIAGIVDSNAPMSWHGTQEGAFFFNAQGTANGSPLTSVWRSSDAADVASWPDAARVPQGDASADLYAPALQGKIGASAQDVWFLSWDGDPNKLAGRKHPIGIMAETRGMAFNTAGKEDILFFVYTLYNITCDGLSTEGAHCYDAARPTIRDTLNQVSHRFVTGMSAKFGEAMPNAGYRIQSAFVAFGADNDVTVEASGSNYDGVSVPFAVGYTYHESFTAEPSWTFDPQIYRAPFFAGAGFIGVKYLKSPVGADGREVGLTLFGATTNGGQFSDPVNTEALYRYLSGTNSSAKGDDTCNVGDVLVTHICFINQGTAADMRFFEASGPLTLAPGQFTSIVVAYIFAAPVATAACPRADCAASVPPQSPTNSLTRFLSPDSVVLGVNTVDKMTGFVSYNGDGSGALPANGLIEADEITTVPGSLLGKAGTAQAVFSSGFAQPEAPAAPAFYLIPGDKQVTVLWLPSPSETTGDNYFITAQNPQTFDPNYRRKDVVGYRVYRGNNQDPSTFRLLAQYNYASGTPVMTFTDHTGQINRPTETPCAPELGIFTTDGTCTSAGTVFGVPLIDPVDFDLAADAQLVQRTSSIALLDGNALATAVDTALTGRGNSNICGAATPCSPLENGGGVPFLYIDHAVQNNRTYFYTVTSFDLNSIRSGPSSQESARIVKPIVPSPAAVGSSSTSNFSQSLIGRGGVVLAAGTAPTLDATTGEFSGPAQPTNAASVAFAGQFVSQLFDGTNHVDVTLTDVDLGDARNGTPVTYTYQFAGPRDTTTTTLQILQSLTGGDIVSGTTGPQGVVRVDRLQAIRNGVSPAIKGSVALTTSLDIYQVTNSEGRGCADGSVVPPAGTDCIAWGPRWFDGANESTPNPNAGTGFNNAGALTGVNTIQWPSAFANYGNGLRIIDAQLGGGVRAADMKVYWGNNGAVDSVIDVTHNVVVPFQPGKAGAGWGILNVSNTNVPGSFDQRPTVVTFADLSCAEPWHSVVPPAQQDMRCTSANAVQFDSVARPGAVAFATTSEANIRTAAVAAGPGFVMYIAGHEFTFELASATPPSNTVWTLRSYIGGIFQDAGNAYTFVPGPVRSFSAIGSGVRFNYTATNSVVAPATPGGSIANVHTVPDPYYVTTGLETTTDIKTIKFVNLPPQANIRIYTTAGQLVRVLQHDNAIGNFENWDVRNRNNQFVASGVYFYSVEDIHSGARRVGRMTIINFTR